MVRFLFTPVSLVTFVLFALVAVPATAQEDNPESNPEINQFTPLWIGRHKDAPNWTEHTRDAIRNYGTSMMAGSSDMPNFCPNYQRLSSEDKANFWIQLIAAMVKYESSFVPETRYVESTMGKDPVTGKQVVSEGLLQLSYQDELNYRSKVPPGVCDFDYAKDQGFPLKDVRRSIQNPKNNLTCGVGILNSQIQRKGAIAIGSGAYWSVIKSGSRYSKLTEIKRITKSLSFCS